MRIAHISDLHITAGPGGPGLVRPDAVARARALIADLARPELALDFVVITGDNVNDARPEEYAVLREVLAGLSLPYAILPGNHDSRSELRASCSDQPWADPVFLFQERRVGALRLLTLDSLSEGRISGTLDSHQLDWLETRLAQPFDGQTMVALHHPPAPTGMGRLDGNILTEGADRLQALIAAQSRPVVVLCGHMHRPFALPWGQALVFAATSTAFQFALRLDDPAEPPATDEPFHYMIHRIGADGDHAVHLRFPDL